MFPSAEANKVNRWPKLGTLLVIEYENCTSFRIVIALKVTFFICVLAAVMHFTLPSTCRRLVSNVSLERKMDDKSSLGV